MIFPDVRRSFRCQWICRASGRIHCFSPHFIHWNVFFFKLLMCGNIQWFVCRQISLSDTRLSVDTPIYQISDIWMSSGIPTLVPVRMESSSQAVLPSSRRFSRWPSALLVLLPITLGCWTWSSVRAVCEVTLSIQDFSISWSRGESKIRENIVYISWRVVLPGEGVDLKSVWTYLSGVSETVPFSPDSHIPFTLTPTKTPVGQLFTHEFWEEHVRVLVTDLAVPCIMA